MNNNNTNCVIVVIGPSRSGTAIIMQVLESLGMISSQSMIPTKENDSIAAYEDPEIFRIQEKLSGQNTVDAMAPPAGWLDKNETHKIEQELKEILEVRMQNIPTVFGFKDPRTALFLPLWTKIFNELNITPLYVLATREPQSVIKSMAKQWNVNESVTELFWLTNNTEALRQTGGNCFIAHYEDWFSEKAPEIAEQLLEYTGLDKFWDSSENIADVLPEAVRSGLDAPVYNGYEVKNRYVVKLHRQLRQCSGYRFDRQALMEVVMECREAMGEFAGWVFEAHRLLRQCNVGMVREKHVLGANKYLQRCKDLGDENENLRIRLSVIETALKARDRKMFYMITSTSFKVGKKIADTLTKLCKSTMPFFI